MEQIKRQELLFDLNQSKPRALIRIKEQRAGPVDVMLANLYSALDPMFNYELSSLGYQMAQQPMSISKLSLPELHQIQKDLEYTRLDENTRVFWEKIEILILKEIEKRSTFSRSSGILEDLATMISGKSLEDLLGLEIEIINKINSGGIVDFDYWNMALRFLQVVLAEKEVEKIYNGFWEKYKTLNRDVDLESLEYPLKQPKPTLQVNEFKPKEELHTLKESKHQIKRIKVIPKEYKHLPIMKESEFKSILENMINENSLKYIHPKLEGEGGIVESKIKSDREVQREKEFHRDSGLEMTPEDAVFKKDEVFLPCSPVQFTLF